MNAHHALTHKTGAEIQRNTALEHQRNRIQMTLFRHDTLWSKRLTLRGDYRLLILYSSNCFTNSVNICDKVAK